MKKIDKLIRAISAKNQLVALKERYRFSDTEIIMQMKHSIGRSVSRSTLNDYLAGKITHPRIQTIEIIELWIHSRYQAADYCEPLVDHLGRSHREDWRSIFQKVCGEYKLVRLWTFNDTGYMVTGLSIEYDHRLDRHTFKMWFDSGDFLGHQARVENGIIFWCKGHCTFLIPTPDQIFTIKCEIVTETFESGKVEYGFVGFSNGTNQHGIVVSGPAYITKELGELEIGTHDLKEVKYTRLRSIFENFKNHQMEDFNIKDNSID